MLQQPSTVFSDETVILLAVDRGGLLIKVFIKKLNSDKLRRVRTCPTTQSHNEDMTGNTDFIIQ